ncbi:MAG TPA: nuclear transport factor 2 family protein [Polyangiales bacterium]
MSDDLSDFRRFLEQRESAARAYVCGDAKALNALAAHSGEVTFFGPQGDVVRGAQEVWRRYEHDAPLFQPGSETRFEVLQMQASDGLAYWVGFQHARVRMAGREEPVTMKLRITELFRRHAEQGWQLVHRHADAADTNAAQR